MAACPPPDPKPRRPHLQAPAGACDCHAHVFDGARFAYQPNRGYTPPDNPVTRLLALHDTLGFARGVVVQASVHGIDNAAVLDAASAHPQRLRAVAAVVVGGRWGIEVEDSVGHSYSDTTLPPRGFVR